MTDYKVENQSSSKISNKALKILIKIQLQCNSKLREPRQEMRTFCCPGTTEASLVFTKGETAAFTRVLKAQRKIPQTFDF